jgi:hypothetical protein
MLRVRLILAFVAAVKYGMLAVAGHIDATIITKVAVAYEARAVTVLV